MTMMWRSLMWCALLLTGASELRANPPVASHIFPPGGQRGKTVQVRVAGLFLNKTCGFELLGPGLVADKQIKSTRTPWFEGPILPLVESQQAEDYPRDMAGTIRIAADAPLGVCRGRVWTAEGAASGLQFVVGDLPEIVEQEIDGDPIPVDVQLPVTINGRIFPREDVDEWAFVLKKGQSVACEVNAARIGSPLDSQLELLDPSGRVVAENDDHFGADSYLRYTGAADGKYRVRIRDVNRRGGPAYVYRLTLTTNAYVDRIYPLGGKRGAKTRFEVHGQGLPAEAVEISLPDDATRDFSYRHMIDGKSTNPLLLDVDDLTEFVQTEANNDAGKANAVTLPAALNGRINKAGAADYWSFPAKKGETLTLEMRARQLGSPLQAVVTVTDPIGKELARAEATGAQLDPTLNFTAPADGTYLIRVVEKVASRGGPEFVYRLRVAPQTPGFRLQLAADVLTVQRGGQAKFKVTAERHGGFTDAIGLRVENLPAGVRAANATIGANQNAVEIAFTAETGAAIAAGAITIRGSATIAGQTVMRTATLPLPRGQPEVDSIMLAVPLPVPFKLVADYDMRYSTRGSTYRRKYKIERNGYDGPLEIRIADRQARHLQGVTGPTLTVPADVNEFEYPIQLAPWMEIGRTCRVCVMATGVVKDGDTEHEVSFSAVGQNDQIVTVVETGRLGVEAEKMSLAAKRGESVTLTAKVVRGKGLTGPVKLELVVPEHVRGVSAEAVTVAADQGRGTLTIRFGRDSVGPFNMPLTLRASLTEDSGPVIAETKMEIVFDD
jgi:hypothetical protein